MVNSISYKSGASFEVQKDAKADELREIQASEYLTPEEIEEIQNIGIDSDSLEVGYKNTSN
ncbi:MAG: hypothetical protein DWQ02_21610 [Bacteroidetes bacterium]|nr:MAG: hypothetical protein DWQ02_21610 [Bacteroidota bacterium]